MSKSLIWLKLAVISLLGAMPILTQAPQVYAATQLTNREARVTTTKVNATFNITLEFDIPTGFSSAVQGIEIEFCDTPLGTCTTNTTPTIPASSTVTQGTWTNSTAFGTYTQQNGDSGGTGNQIKVSRTQTLAETAGVNRSVSFTGLTNDPLANKTYYPRIRLYSDTATTTLVAEGVVAQTTAEQLVVNARVQERLDFCVGSTSINDATTTPGADCTAITGNTVDIGIIDSSAVNVSPVTTVNGGNNLNGLAMVRTNAANGAVVDYFAEQDTSSGKLKVPGATCSGTATTDQCFNSQGTTQGTFTAGTEKFGMTIAGTNCGSTTGYSCTFTAGTHNLKADAQYQGEGTFGSTYVFGTANGFAWDDTGTTDRIASSAGSSVKVIDDEALVIKFAATASVTTPTGQYTVTSTYIATATF